jgi:hypothetical protein
MELAENGKVYLKNRKDRRYARAAAAILRDQKSGRDNLLGAHLEYQEDIRHARIDRSRDQGNADDDIPPRTFCTEIDANRVDLLREGLGHLSGLGIVAGALRRVWPQTAANMLSDISRQPDPITVTVTNL